MVHTIKQLEEALGVWRKKDINEIKYHCLCEYFHIVHDISYKQTASALEECGYDLFGEALPGPDGWLDLPYEKGVRIEALKRMIKYKKEQEDE